MFKAFGTEQEWQFCLIPRHSRQLVKCSSLSKINTSKLSIISIYLYLNSFSLSPLLLSPLLNAESSVYMRIWLFTFRSIKDIVRLLLNIFKKWAFGKCIGLKWQAKKWSKFNLYISSLNPFSSILLFHSSFPRFHFYTVLLLKTLDNLVMKTEWSKLVSWWPDLDWAWPSNAFCCTLRQKKHFTT